MSGIRPEISIVSAFSVLSNRLGVVSEVEVVLAVPDVECDVRVLDRLFRNGFVAALVDTVHVNVAAWMFVNLGAHSIGLLLSLHFKVPTRQIGFAVLAEALLTLAWHPPRLLQDGAAFAYAYLCNSDR